ncbi:MAG: AMP-binding protein [Verrucomicrobia bacterium]|nr:AMP-binding protein [Verrucomicrobiota bacterium]
MMVQDLLQQSAARLPNKTALVCGGQRLTYAEIEAMANRLANALVQHGVRRGDRVALYLPNCVEAVVGIFATLKAGAVFVMVNSTTKRDKLLYILNNCRAGALLLDERGAAQSGDDILEAQVPSLKLVVLTGPRAEQTCAGKSRWFAFDAVQRDFPAVCPPPVNIDLDLACLIYTSGSTGDPKGVMSAHSNVVFAATSITTYLENVESDIVINVLPLSFDYGLYQLLMVFKFGGTLVLEKSFAFPVEILKLMERERVTGFPGVPTIYALLLQIDLSQFDLSSLRYLTNTAAALPPSHILEIRKKFSWAKLYSMYGLTETKRTLYLPPDQLEKRPGSVGIAIPGTEVWVADEAGNRLGPGEVGELVVRGRHVMRGYWEAPEATAKRYRPGLIPGERLCYTGDLFRMDDEGYMYFVGRKDDIIKSRGEKVAPKEVENVLYGIKGVVEAAVVGVPDPVLGQAVKAILVVNGATLTEKEVLAHCRAHLEDYMVPKHVEFRAELPKTTSGKIKKTDLV